MAYEAVGFDPVNNMLAPIVQTALDTRYPVGGQAVAANARQSYIDTTLIDVSGLSVTVNSPGTTASWLVLVSLDVDTGQTNSPVFIAMLVVDGGPQLSQIIVAYPVAGQRQTVSQSFLVAGLAAGSHVMKVSAQLTAAGGAYNTNVRHSTMIVVQVA